MTENDPRLCHKSGFASQEVDFLHFVKKLRDLDFCPIFTSHDNPPFLLHEGRTQATEIRTLVVFVAHEPNGLCVSHCAKLKLW